MAQKKIFRKLMEKYGQDDIAVLVELLETSLLAVEYHYEKYGKNRTNDVVEPLVQKAIISANNISNAIDVGREREL